MLRVMPTPVHDRLLQVAKELFASDGYESTTTSAIARRAGTSESQLIKHFGSKEGLLEAIFDEGWRAIEQDVRGALSLPGSPLERFVALGNAFIRGVGGDDRLRTLLLLEGRRIRKRGHDVVLSAGFRNFVAMLDKVLEEMQAAGQLRPGVHVQAVRSALMGSLEGLLRDQLLSRLTDYPAAFGRRELLATYTTVLGAFVQPDALRLLREQEEPATSSPTS